MTEKTNDAQAQKVATNSPLQINTETAGRIVDITSTSKPADDVTSTDTGFTVNGLAHGGPGALGFRDGGTLELPHERAARQHGRKADGSELDRVRQGVTPNVEEATPGAAAPSIQADAIKAQDEATEAKAKAAKS